MLFKTFNIGNILSLEDMRLAIDYLLDRDVFEPELQHMKEKIATGDKCIKTSIKNE